MIQANELRIGNLVFRDELNIENGKWDKLTIKINYQDIFNLINGNDMVKTAYNPIPLTEEWFVKFGFEEVHFKNRHYSITDKNGFKDSHKISILPTINEQWYIAFSDTLSDYKDYIPTTKIKYVHELQNLIFALTGEELTLKN